MGKNMETKEVTTLVEVTRWICAVEGHSHRTKDVAQRCIEKNRNRGMARRRWTVSMIADVCADIIVAGMTYKSVGEKYGLNPERIRQVYHKGLRMMLTPARLDEPVPEHNTLSVQSVRSNADFWSRRIAKLRNAP